MRTLWNIISFLAVVHLLALAIFVGWLWQSHRITTDRLQEVRQVFALTVEQAQAQAAKAEAESKAQLGKQADEARIANPPLDSATQIEYVSLIQDQQEQSRRRLEADKRLLLQQLNQATAKISTQQAELERQRKSWETETKVSQQRKNDEQFLQTVKQYELLPAKQGKKMLAELVRQNQMDEAVAYLCAMNSRAASKILREFKGDAEVALATELLERMRTHGRGEGEPAATGATTHAADAGAAQDSAHANAADNAAG